MPRRDEILLTRAQVREVDRRAIEEYGIPGIVLMENAGRQAAEIVAALASSVGNVAQPPSAVSSIAARIIIVCGRGNNGGDGFVIARHLHNRGFEVEIFLCCDPAKLTGDAATNFHIIDRMGMPRQSFATAEEIAATAATLRKADLIVDALLGTGFVGEARAPLDAVIGAINAARGAGKDSREEWVREGILAPGAPQAPVVIAIDVPSGLDCDTGRPSNATLRADHTITFVARKTGFVVAGAEAYTGIVHVADIGAPREIIEAVMKGQ